MIQNDFSLEESIRNYERENNRKQSLESKASYLLGIISIFTGIWGIFVKDIINISITTFPSNIIIYLSLLTIILIVFCAVYCLNVLKIRKHAFPIEGNDPNILRSQLSKPENELKKELFDSYIASFSVNNLKNNEKARYLFEAYKLLLYGIISSIVTIIALLVI